MDRLRGGYGCPFLLNSIYKRPIFCKKYFFYASETRINIEKLKII